MPWGLAATVAGGLLGGIFSGKGQRDANKQNREEAQRNRDFQMSMSNTAVERRMADLKRSGINPLLAGKYDASSPAGNMATMGNVGAAAVEGAERGVKTAKTGKEVVSLMKAQIDKLGQEARLTSNAADMSEITLKGMKHVGAGSDAIDDAVTALGSTGKDVAKKVHDVTVMPMGVYWDKKKSDYFNASGQRMKKVNGKWRRR